MRRSPEVQKNLRAKTVRIGKIRWPPPLNPDEADNASQQRFVLENFTLNDSSSIDIDTFVFPFFRLTNSSM